MPASFDEAWNKKPRVRFLTREGKELVETRIDRASVNVRPATDADREAHPDAYAAYVEEVTRPEREREAFEAAVAAEVEARIGRRGRQGKAA